MYENNSIYSSLKKNQILTFFDIQYKFGVILWSPKPWCEHHKSTIHTKHTQNKSLKILLWIWCIKTLVFKLRLYFSPCSLREWWWDWGLNITLGIALSFFFLYSELFWFKKRKIMKNANSCPAFYCFKGFFTCAIFSLFKCCDTGLVMFCCFY
jgi:hypothetical protein